MTVYLHETEHYEDGDRQANDGQSVATLNTLSVSNDVERLSVYRNLGRR